MPLAFVPPYIKFMSIETYGLVRISLSLMTIFSILNLGLCTTLNRELARLSAHQGKSQVMRDLVRMLQVVYWPIGGFIGKESNLDVLAFY